MTYGSVCSGIEAATVAWEPLGWKSAWFAEIDPFCNALLKHHYPKVKNYGDFTKIGADAGPIDLLVGGTPCQAFSVAGLRGGLDDARGNLTLEFIRLAGRLRPRWIVWENVPGVFSSITHNAPDPRPPEIDLDGDNGPKDGEEVVVEDEYDSEEVHAFSCFLAGLSELGYGFSYRILDAQFHGVPQRRRRVFVVGYFGDWRRAAAVFFERESLCGHPPPSRKAGQDVAPTLSARTKGGGGLGTDFDRDGGLIAFGGGNTAGAIDVATACNAHGGSGRMDFDTETFVVHTLRGDGFDASEDGSGRGTPLVPVAFRGFGQERFVPRNVSPPVVAAGGNTTPMILEARFQVRRLTPREGERLQGFPDDYTLIPYRGKLAADGPRYRAIGNSMAVPVMRWIGERIQFVDEVAQ